MAILLDVCRPYWRYEVIMTSGFNCLKSREIRPFLIRIGIKRFDLSLGVWNLVYGLNEGIRRHRHCRSALHRYCLYLNKYFVRFQVVPHYGHPSSTAFLQPRRSCVSGLG